VRACRVGAGGIEDWSYFDPSESSVSEVANFLLSAECKMH